MSVPISDKPNECLSQSSDKPNECLSQSSDKPNECLSQSSDKSKVTRKKPELGGSADGDYLIPDDLDLTNICLTPGCVNAGKFSSLSGCLALSRFETLFLKNLDLFYGRFLNNISVRIGISIEIMSDLVTLQVSGFHMMRC